VRFLDHFDDVCRGAGLSWAKASNPYDSSTDAATRWAQTKTACNNYCNAPGQEGRGIGAAITIGIDNALGYPTVQVEGIDLTFASVPYCPAGNDLRIYHPKRTGYTCVDTGTKHPGCEVFDQSILYGAPLTCLGLQFFYDAAVSILMDALKVGARIAINQQLTQALSVKCSKDSDCQAGAICSTVKISDGFPAGCADTSCMMPPVSDQVCNANGKVVPPLAGIERQLNVAKLSPAYTPDNAGPVKVIAAIGGFAASDSDQQVQALGLPVSDDNRGFTIGGFFGVETHRASCVAPKGRPQQRTIEPLVLGDKVELYDSATKQMAKKGYHAAVSLHQDALSQLAYAVYTNGALCLTFSGTPDFPLNSAVLSFIVTSVRDLDLGGGSRPAFLYVYPEEIPELRVGEGKLHYEGTKAVIDSPHLEMSVRKVRIEFYSSVRERFVRLFSLSVDFQLGVFFEFTDDNTLLPITRDLKGGISGVSVKNVEILSEKSSDLEKTIPGLLDFALPLVSQALLQGIELPEPTVLPGYEFKMLGLRGVKQQSGTAPARYEFLSAFGKLQKSGTPARDEDVIAIAPRVSVERIEMPEEGLPKVTLQVGALDQAFDGEDLEFSFSLNGGVYSPFSAARSIEIEREQLRFEGPHAVDVKVRKLGARAISEAARASFIMTPGEIESWLSPQTSPTRSGCNASGASTVWLVLAAMVLLVRRRGAR
jgi:hypothetical protein